MHAYVLRRNLVDQWRVLVAWAAGLLLLVLLYISLYPAIHSSGFNIQQLLNQMPAALRNAFLGAGVNYDTPTGYLGTELFAFLLPVILLAVAVVGGSRALAGEEGAGTIDLLLATPLRRRRLVVEKSLAAVLPVLGLGVLVWLLVALLGPAFNVQVPLSNLAIALLAVALLAITFGELALAVGGATGKRGLGAGIAGGLAVALYALNAVAPSVTGLQGLDNVVSPFHWSGGPGVLANGVEWGGMLALIIVPVVLLGIAVLTYDRRDIST
jgi:ABC-2 type transport system permease protein